ncbi:Polyphenol oxidase [biofilm metagenome]
MNSNKPFLPPDWPAPENIHAATTYRTGGFSTGCFDSLNLATHVGDELERVQQNRALMISMLQLPSEPIWLCQIHSNIAVEAKPDLQTPKADASFTGTPGIVCVVMTADCLPVLLCSRDGNRIAAIHAGWRGLLDGVIANTIKAMQTTDVLVWLGPAIGPLRFEVGAEVRDAFINKSSAYGVSFTQRYPDKWLADIYQLARTELACLGIYAVYGGGSCTVTDKERYYSYRRDNQCGRMATLIWRD